MDEDEVRSDRAPSSPRPSPRARRHPLRALDGQAMELASGDAALRAALFRFVDVTPACRTLDDLARHLDELPRPRSTSRPPRSRRRCGWRDTRAGRAALGAAAAAGRQAHGPPLHRRRDAAEALRRRCARCGSAGIATSVDLLGEATVTARRGRPLRGALRGGAGATLAAAPALAGAPDARARLGGAAAARQPLGEGLGAHAAAAPRGARARAATTRPAPAAPAAPGAASSGAHLHVDMESLDSREATLELVLELLAEPEFRDGPVGRHRPPGLPARLARPARAAPRLGGRGERRAPPLTSGSSRAPTGTTRSSRPASTAGRRRSSRTRPSATATSRRSRGG